MIKICSHQECIAQLKTSQQGGNLKMRLMAEQGNDDDDYSEGGDVAVICITNKGVAVPEEIAQFTKTLLHLEFDDVDFEDKEYTPPQAEDINKALKFAKRYEDIIVCCNAGISRSAALAYVIECTRVAHPKLAAGLWSKKRHHPNRRIVRLGSEILGKKELESVLDLWLYKTTG